MSGQEGEEEYKIMISTNNYICQVVNLTCFCKTSND